MSTAALFGPVPAGKIDVRPLPAQFPGREPIRLTTNRISKTHHGRTLQILGHAAEYLMNSRVFLIEESVSESSRVADDEAVRILMRLSSEVFRDYARSVRVRRPVEDMMMGCLGTAAGVVSPLLVM